MHALIAWHYMHFKLKLYLLTLLQVLHRHKSGQRKTRTVSITIHCYDIRVVKLTFIADMDATTFADFTDGKSPEFLASTNSSSQQQGERERVTGDGGGVHDRIAQKIKDFATQSPKLLKGMTDKVKGVGGVGGGANTSAEVHTIMALGEERKRENE